jgi:hypothetical protein
LSGGKISQHFRLEAEGAFGILPHGVASFQLAAQQSNASWTLCYLPFDNE